MVSVREIQAKSVLSKSGIPGFTYCVNPYVGCAHACRYCYASFMKRFTGHPEPWGTFVDVRVNAPQVLERNLTRAKPGTVMFSSVTDAYQPIEGRYRLARRCLEALVRSGFPVRLLTKSPLVLRDLDLLEAAGDIEVGLTISTDNEAMRRTFEPGAATIEARLHALRELHAHGVRTYAFVGPVLPMDPERLAEQIGEHADTVLVDRMNYPRQTAGLYRRLGLDRWLEKDFVAGVVERFRARVGRDRISLV